MYTDQFTYENSVYKIGDILTNKIASYKHSIYIKILYLDTINETETVGFEFIRKKEFARIDIDFAPIKDVNKYYRHATEQELMELIIKEIIE